MNPLAALIGGASSLIGGFMNTSSQQAINAANLQQQQWSATGGYLPGLVENAKRAGLNPLAVLGQRGPDMAVQTGSSPGAGLSDFGRMLGQVDPYTDELNRARLEREKVDIANARLAGNNAAIEGARNMWVLEQMQADRARHPDVIMEGLQWPSLVGSGADWLNNLKAMSERAGADVRGFMSRIPQSMWSTP